MQVDLLCMKVLQEGLYEGCHPDNHMNMLKRCQSACLHSEGTQEGRPINNLQDALQDLLRLTDRRAYCTVQQQP